MKKLIDHLLGLVKRSPPSLFYLLIIITSFITSLVSKITFPNSVTSSSNSSSLSPSLSLLSLPKLMLHCWLLLSYWSLMTKCPHFIPDFDPSWTCRVSTENWPLVCFDISLEIFSLSLLRNDLSSPLSSWKVVQGKRNEKVKDFLWQFSLLLSSPFSLILYINSVKFMFLNMFYSFNPEYPIPNIHFIFL